MRRAAGKLDLVSCESELCDILNQTSSILDKRASYAPYLLKNPKSKDSSLGKWQARVVQSAPLSRMAAMLNC